MIRQARTYLVGAMSGASLIAIAIAVFVLLVSTQVFSDWPVAGLIGGDDSPSVSSAEETAGPGASSPAATKIEGAAGAGQGEAAGKADGGPGGGGSAGRLDNAGGQGETPAGGGGDGGGSTGGGGTEGGSAPTGSGGSTESSGGSGGTAGGGGGGGTGGQTTTSSPSSKVTGTVKETVDQVDETVTGGAIEETGATQTAEEVVEGAAGPESPVGKAVDETAKTVEGVIGQK